MALPVVPEQHTGIDATRSHWVVSGPPRSGKSRVLAAHLRELWREGLDGERLLILTPDRRSARRLTGQIGQTPDNAAGRARAMSYHSFAQDLIRRWWPLVVEQFGLRSATPAFLPFNLTQYACLSEYRDQPGNLQRLTIREQRLIVQVLSNMNLSAANGLSLPEGWERVAAGLGLSASDEIIRDGLDLTLRFRERCLAAGVLPLDLQIEAAGWLLADERVRRDLLSRYDVLALDDLDEFVPLMAERLTAIATGCQRAVVTHSEDGGLRWMLGASVRAASRLCEGLVDSGSYESLMLGAGASPSHLAPTAAWLADAVAGGEEPPPVADGWQLSSADRPDKMAGQVVDRVEQLLAGGVAPGEIALLIPYMDTLIATEIERQCRQRGIPFRRDQRWQSLLDDPLSRACLTALRCVNPGKTRKATLVEVADLVVAVTEENPIVAQKWARMIFKAGSGELRDPGRNAQVPRTVRLLGIWGKRATEQEHIHQQLEILARRVLAPHDSKERPALVRACYALANEARRFQDAARALQLEEPYDERFFDYVDSDVVAADTGQDPDDDALVLTTPYAFMTSGRSAAHQCWLNVASPAWWEPPLLMLANPHAMSGEAGTGRVPHEDEERIRATILGRIVRNLAARCDAGIHAFASLTDSDGAPLDGPLYDYLVELQGAGR